MKIRFVSSWLSSSLDNKSSRILECEFQCTGVLLLLVVSGASSASSAVSFSGIFWWYLFEHLPRFCKRSAATLSFGSLSFQALSLNLDALPAEQNSVEATR